MQKLFYNNGMFTIYEERGDNVRCVACMDYEVAPDLTIGETTAYAKLFVAAPKMRDELQAILTLLENGQPLDPEHDGARIKELLKRLEA